MQKLRDNASRFKKDLEIMNLVLVRKRTIINCQYENESQIETEQQENPINGIQLEALKESVEKDEDQEIPVQIKAEDESLNDYSFMSFNIWFIATCQDWNPERNYKNLNCQKRSRRVQLGS